jgi:hypothetical protein
MPTSFGAGLLYDDSTHNGEGEGRLDFGIMSGADAGALSCNRVEWHRMKGKKKVPGGRLCYLARHLGYDPTIRPFMEEISFSVF